jgi:hypothetical protein
VTWTVLFTLAAQRESKTISKRYPHLLECFRHIHDPLRADPLHPNHRFEAFAVTSAVITLAVEMGFIARSIA